MLVGGPTSLGAQRESFVAGEAEFVFCDQSIGTTYNLLWRHSSLAEGSTPAMAASLTDHRWSMEELLGFQVPPAQLPRWRGRKPRWLLEIENAT